MPSRMRMVILPALFALSGAANAQEIRRYDRHATLPISKLVEVPSLAETLYLSGEVASPVDPAAPTTSPQSYGDTQAQTVSVFRKMERTLAARGYSLGDVVKLTVFLVGVPDRQGRLDMDGFTRGYRQFFGTDRQPNLPARSTVQVAALGNPGYLVEIEAIAARPTRPIATYRGAPQP